jgi:hypothetical protein
VFVQNLVSGEQRNVAHRRVSDDEAIERIAGEAQVLCVRDELACRYVAQDLAEMALGLPSAQKEILSESLREKTGRTLEDLDRNLRAKAKKIIRKQRIQSAEEFRTVLAFVEREVETNAASKQIETANRLLADFETSSAGKSEVD